MGSPIAHYGRWRIRWTDENGARHSEVLTHKRDAEFKLRQHELEVEERRRGLRPPAMERKTFADAADYWERERSPGKRSFKDDVSMLKQLRLHFGNLQLNDGEAWVVAVDRYKASKASLSPKTVANHLTLLGSILRVAEEMRWLERLPKIRKPRIKAAGTDFSYLRTEDEIRRFL